MRLKDIEKDMEVVVQNHPDYAGATGTVISFGGDGKVIVTLKDDPDPRWFYPRELYLKKSE